MLKKHGLARIKALFQVSILCLEERTQFFNETIVQQLINLAYIYICVFHVYFTFLWEDERSNGDLYSIILFIYVLASFPFVFVLTDVLESFCAIVLFWISNGFDSPAHLYNFHFRKWVFPSAAFFDRQKEGRGRRCCLGDGTLRFTTRMIWRKGWIKWWLLGGMDALIKWIVIHLTQYQTTNLPKWMF